MSGTSLDGVDAAWLETDGIVVHAFGPSLTIPYDPGLRSELRALLECAATLEATDPRLLRVTETLTDCHARAVAALDVPADLIGFHGQTILHQPDRRRTWQIGDAARLAQRCGVPVAHDFRSADVAAGGQGAPLVPVFHQALARDLPKPLAVLNIGGVANVTWIGEDESLLAFDTGPGNALIDDWVFRHIGERCDRDGALAASGRVDAGVLQHLLSLAYFQLPAPKSLDRLSFAASVEAAGLYRLSLADGAATLTRFTVEAVAAARFPAAPRRWLVCGGGRHNPALMAELQAILPAPVGKVEDVGWDGDALEAQCFAYLATRVQRGLPLSFPGTTGVKAPLCGGQIVSPAF